MEDEEFEVVEVVESRKILLSEGKQTEEDDADLQKAAVKVQSSFRGYSERKRQKGNLKATNVRKREEDASQGHKQNIGQTMEDERELEAAAVKVQSMYRGFSTRKKASRQSIHSEVPSGRLIYETKPAGRTQVFVCNFSADIQAEDSPG